LKKTWPGLLLLILAKSRPVTAAPATRWARIKNHFQQRHIIMAVWTRACATNDIEPDDLIRFDHGTQTFVIIRTEKDEFFAMDGICSHEHVHLCGGLVMDGIVECPKHNATFDYRTGDAKRAPACINLRTFPVKVEGDEVFLEI
jgi:3-phenylpropionate/trans-cinnamate dioxygenase ferredoxin component